MTATVTVTVPAMVVPFIVEVPSFRLTSSHTEPVDSTAPSPVP